MKHIYKTNGTCSKEITFELEGNHVKNVLFYGGCNGNLKAISKLVEGMELSKVVSLLKGNTCGFRSTSCADQLALALISAAKKEGIEIR